MHIIVRRHKLRVCQFFSQALAESARQGTRSYVSVARDEVRGRAALDLTEDLREQLLQISNLRYVKNLPGTLPPAQW